MSPKRMLRSKRGLVLIVCITCFLLVGSLKTTKYGAGDVYEFGSVTSGKLHLVNNKCDNRNSRLLFQLDFTANWDDLMPSPSTLFHLGVSESEGLRVDIDRGIEDPDNLSFFLIAGDPTHSPPYRWNEFQLRPTFDESVNVSLRIVNQQYKLVLESPSGNRLSKDGELPAVDCRLIYLGSGKPGLLQGFGSGISQSSNASITNVSIYISKGQLQSAINLPKVVVAGSEFLFWPALGLTFVNLISYLDRRFAFVILAKLKRKFRCAVQLVIHNRYMYESPRSEVNLILAAFVALYVIGMGFIYYRYQIQNLDFPKNTFLPHPLTRGGDFFLNFSEWYVHGGFGKASYGLLYLPATYFWIELLQIFFPNPYTAIAISRLFLLCALLILVFVILKTRGFLTSLMGAAITLFSYPVIFLFFSGNLEFLVTLCFLIGILGLINGNWRIYAVAIGIAGSFKIVPFIFLLVLVSHENFRRWIRLGMLSAATALLANFLALLILPGGMMSKGVSGMVQAIEGTVASMRLYNEMMVLGPSGINFGHSPLNAIHAIWGLDTLPSDTWGTPLFVGLLFLGLAIVFLLRSLGSPLWYFLLFVGVLGCITTPTSTEYKLAYLLPGLLLFLRDGLRDQRELWPVLLSITTLVPKPWFYIGSNVFNPATLWLTSLTLVLLTFLIPVTAVLISKSPSRSGQKIKTDVS